MNYLKGIVTKTLESRVCSFKGKLTSKVIVILTKSTKVPLNVTLNKINI